MPQMPTVFLLMWGKSSRAAEWSLNFSSAPGGGGMREGMPGACCPSLEMGLAGEAAGAAIRLPSARHERRPLCAASRRGESAERGLLCGHSFSSVSLLPPLCPWVGSTRRAQMKEFLSLHSGC